jgi:hypothetical protein
LPRQGRHDVKAATRRKPVEESIKKIAKTGHGHVVEGSYENEATSREHKQDCHDRAGML